MSGDKERERFEEYREILKKYRLFYDSDAEYTDNVVERTTKYVLGPGMNGFVIWVLQNAVKRKIQRLYFLARDGYFMYLCARIYCEKFSLPIELRYLSCSRYSIRIPMFHLDKKAALDSICRGGIDVTVDKILDRAGLRKEEKTEIEKSLKLPFGCYEPVPYACLAKVRDELHNCERFMSCMCRNSEKAFPNLKGYLEQEGLLEDSMYAFVDSGWVGSMQKNLNQVLLNMGRKEEAEGYYWGLYELPEGVRREHYHCYYFKPEWDLKKKVYFSNCLFEVIFSAPHGMTLKYEKKENIYVPVYASVRDQKKEFIKKTEKYMIEYTQQAADKIDSIEKADITMHKKAAEKLFARFMGKPAKKEAEIYGALEFSDDVLEKTMQQTAAVMSHRELSRNHVFYKVLTMMRIRKSHIKESAWYEGSAVRHGKNTGYHLLLYSLYKYLIYIRKTYYYLKRKEK